MPVGNWPVAFARSRTPAVNCCDATRGIRIAMIAGLCRVRRPVALSTMQRAVLPTS